MKEMYKVEEESSFENPATSSSLVHLTKERPKSQRKSLKEKSDVVPKKSRSFSTGEFTQPLQTSKATSIKRQIFNEPKKSPPPLSPKPKQKRSEYSTINESKQFRLPPLSPKPQSVLKEEKNPKTSAPFVSPKPSRRIPSVKSDESATAKIDDKTNAIENQHDETDFQTDVKDTEPILLSENKTKKNQKSAEEKTESKAGKAEKPKMNWKNNSFRKNLSRFGESVASVRNSVATSSFRNKKQTIQKSEKESLLDPDEQTDKMVKDIESQNREKKESQREDKDKNERTNDKESKLGEEESNSGREVASQAGKTNRSKERKNSQDKKQGPEKRKISSTKLTLRSPFKRGKEYSVTTSTTDYKKLKDSPKADQKEITLKNEENKHLTLEQCNGNADNKNLVTKPIDCESTEDQTSENDLLTNSSELEDASTVHSLGEVDNKSSEAVNLEVSKEKDTVKTKSKVNQSLLEQIDTSTTATNHMLSAQKFKTQSFPTTPNIHSNQYHPSQNDNDNDFKTNASPVVRHKLTKFASFDDSYTAPTVKRSYAMTTYTPKPVKRKISENGRIMCKTESAQNNILRSLSVSMKYEKKSKGQQNKTEDAQTNRRHTFSGGPKKNIPSWSCGSYKKRDDQVKLLTSTSLDEESSDEDSQLNNRINKSSEGYQPIETSEKNNKTFERSRFRKSFSFSKKLSFDKS